MMDRGTIYQLRNLIKWRHDLPHNVDASEDFFLTIVEVSILNAAMDLFLFQMKSLSDHPIDLLQH